MEWTAARPLELVFDAAAATLLGAATAFACVTLPTEVDPRFTGVGTFLLALTALRCIPAGEVRRSLAAFDAAPIVIEDDNGEELLLEDVLRPPAADSRVVQLFDPDRTRVTGEPRASFGDYAQSGPRNQEPQDASQALADALRELRRTLG